jgi:transposase
MIKVKDGKIIIGRSYFISEKSAEISMGKKTIKKHKNIEVKHDCRLLKKNNEYWLCIPILTEKVLDNPPTFKNYCGIDPGIRTFMTVFGNQGVVEYEHNEKFIKSLDTKIKILKSRSFYIHKRKYSKIEKRKENIVDELHWKSIKELLKNNDLLFYGDIKSHNIVRGRKNHSVNRDIMNLKFYKFKERLLEKANERNKIVIIVQEHNTTKTCSFCGTINNPEKSKIYHCSNCKVTCGRDLNAAKNILMKGVINYK